MEASKIVMRKPADFHQHFRQGARLKVTAPLVAKRFGLALQMPNLDTPITTLQQMMSNRWDILEAAKTPGFRVVMTAYMTPTLEPGEVELMCKHPDFAGIKYYPNGLTTKSEFGLKDPTVLWTPGTKPYECLRVLAAYAKVFLIHAADGIARSDVTIRTRHYRAGDELDPYDQEPHFVKCTLPYIRVSHSNLKISFEHISTIEGVGFLREYGNDTTLGCSVTSQHLLIDRRDTHRGGLRPHNFWFPVPQSFEHTQELRKFVGEGHPFVWLGSDSAPHYLKKKEADCCAGGVMTAHAGIELYAEAFANMGALKHFENFASVNGPKFFGFPPSEGTITLVPKPWMVKDLFYVEEADDVEPMRPFRLGEMVQWKLVG
jgi:dihydroorotase